MELAPNRLVYHEVVIFQNICLDRHSVARCLVEHGHIAYGIHRHIQRSRYRRCRQRQNIDILRYLLQLLLVGDAEALFFVYYDESEVMKLYIGGEKSVRADYDVRIAAPQCADSRLLLRMRLEAGEE